MAEFEPCGRGICAAEEGHEGTCEEASGWVNDPLDPFWMRIALGHPDKCHAEVSRQGQVQPCDKVAVALAVDPNEHTPYPACAFHARGEMVPLEAIVRYMLDRHEAQAVIAHGLVAMAEQERGSSSNG